MLWHAFLFLGLRFFPRFFSYTLFSPLLLINCETKSFLAGVSLFYNCDRRTAATFPVRAHLVLLVTIFPVMPQSTGSKRLNKFEVTSPDYSCPGECNF
jgi:hypothetical protein